MATKAAERSQGECASCPAAKPTELRWTLPIRTVTLQGNSLTINLRGPADIGTWRVAAVVKPSADNVAKLQMGELEIASRPDNPGRLRIPTAVNSYVDSELTLRDNEIDAYLRAESANKQTLMYIELPSPVDLQIAHNHDQVIRIAVSDSVQVVDGRLVSQPVQGLASLMLQMITADAPVATQLQNIGDGVYVAPPTKLWENLATYSKPPDLSRQLTSATTATLEITVGSDGLVKHVKGLRGEQELVQHCAQSISAWTFRPFVVDGSPVIVRAPVLIVVDADGRISVPMLMSR